LQLWHVGRISAPLYLDGAIPVAPSAVRPAGHVSLVRPVQNFVTPRALSLDEIAATVADYRQAAVHAKAAGFDGVQLHAANGYLLDQFLQDSTNLRDDVYGGVIENRARLLLKVVDTCIDVWGAGRVGVHLAPRMDAHDMADSNPTATFGYVATELGKRRIAFLSTREHAADNSLTPLLKQLFGGVMIANEQFDKTTANQWIAEGKADAVAFGIPFIANPDLPARLVADAPLNPPRKELFYGQGPVGYTDYPTL
jgi:2,4-dienoyl-CoA reductase-like NADH-dependent reductase (Old Yellow Enzyme family)